MTWRVVARVVSALLLVLIWLGVKELFSVPDRYLPSLWMVAEAVADVGPDLLLHAGATSVRVVAGFLGGVLLGVVACLVAYRFGALNFLMPSINALRAVPPVALLPFFLLWFGFTEVGRIVLLLVGLGVNVFVASAEVVGNPSESDRILFRSFPVRPAGLAWYFWLPRILESLLPTLRFGLSMLIGLVVIAEMLGAQSGLGYLIQTSRSTFSLDVILLSSALLGFITIVSDRVLQILWRHVTFWKT